MKEMIYKDTTCPDCGNKITYWTTRDFVKCQPCGKVIPVEPMEPIEPEEVVEDGTII
jgi:DNA-directed RNA polymerase subunit RPC12/RpoP